MLTFVMYGIHQGFWAIIIHSYDGVHLSSNTLDKEEADRRKENFLYKQERYYKKAL